MQSYNKVVPYVFGVVVLGGVVWGGSIVSRMLLEPEPPLPERIDMKVADDMAQQTLQAKCAACHGANPEYNSVINFISGNMLRRDVENARRAWKMEGDAQVRSGLVDYLKLDNVLTTRRMPPTQYTVVHIGSRLTPQDVSLLRLRYSEQGAAQRRFRPIESAQTPAERKELARMDLGYRLYHDARLSTNNAVSCSSCHDVSKGGTDNKPKSEGVPGADGKPQLGGVNAPTVFNATGHIRQFWDGRAADLKEQAGGPPLNPVEMGYAKPEDWEAIAAKLREDSALVALFTYVYGEEGITGDTITDAIAAFERTLTTPDSAFDRYLKGDEKALDSEQKQGMDAFVRYGCATCHAGPALGGLSFEYINTHAELRAHAKDYKEGAFGLYDFTKRDEHKDMFRVPTLRNVALTHPYFHTGTVQELEDAVRIMFETQCGVVPAADTVRSVTRFLEAQTGTFRGKPLQELNVQDVSPIVHLMEEEEERCEQP